MLRCCQARHHLQKIHVVLGPAEHSIAILLGADHSWVGSWLDSMTFLPIYGEVIRNCCRMQYFITRYKI